VAATGTVRAVSPSATSVEEQMPLCEDWIKGGSAGMEAARKRVTEYQSIRYAPCTVEGYGMDWAHFTGWCRASGHRPIPADPDTVALYLSYCRPGRKVSTLERRLASIISKHREANLPDPVTPAVRAFLMGAKRDSNEKVRRNGGHLTR